MTSLGKLVLTRGAVNAERGVVAAGSPTAAMAGASMFEHGGNAIDAVIAAAFAAFVAEPHMCGIGGGGHLSIYEAATRRFIAIEHNARAPAAAHSEMFELDRDAERTYYGWQPVVGSRNEWGSLAAAVPGAVAGLVAAHERFGSLKREFVLAPAMTIAQSGFELTSDMQVAIAERLCELKLIGGQGEELLLENGWPRPLLEGSQQLRNPALARTLQGIAEQGQAAFYSGRIAAEMVAELARTGGIMTLEDLAAYRPRIYTESPAMFGATAYSTCGDPLGYLALGILEALDVRPEELGTPDYYHVLAEALGHAYSDVMMYAGDPALRESAHAALRSQAHIAARAGAITRTSAAPRPITPELSNRPGAEAFSGSTLPGFAGTSQVVAADHEGNIGSLITTLTQAFGSLVMVPNTGILLNNAMRAFDPRPGRANSIQGGSTPLFAAPAVVCAGPTGMFGFAGSGGYRIGSAVVQAMTNVHRCGLPLQDALDVPRIHCQGDGTFVDSRVSSAVRDWLQAAGHLITAEVEQPIPPRFPRVSAVRSDPETGALDAAGASAWTTATAGA